MCVNGRIHCTWWCHQMETFSELLAICVGNSPVTGEFPAQRPVRRNFDISLICTWINGWVNSCEPGDLRRHSAHYDVTVMILNFLFIDCHIAPTLSSSFLCRNNGRINNIATNHKTYKVIPKHSFKCSKHPFKIGCDEKRIVQILTLFSSVRKKTNMQSSSPSKIPWGECRAGTQGYWWIKIRGNVAPFRSIEWYFYYFLPHFIQTKHKHCRMKIHMN